MAFARKDMTSCMVSCLSFFMLCHPYQSGVADVLTVIVSVPHRCILVA